MAIFALTLIILSFSSLLYLLTQHARLVKKLRSLDPKQAQENQAKLSTAQEINPYHISISSTYKLDLETFSRAYLHYVDLEDPELLINRYGSDIASLIIYLQNTDINPELATAYIKEIHFYPEMAKDKG